MQTFFPKAIMMTVCTAIIISATAQTPAFIQQEIDPYILKGLEQWNVPGLAIVIVKDGKVVLRKGYGVKDITKPGDPVDENTLFFIASNSKLFTGTALAHLQYHKKLNLNDKITKYYPGYRLYDSLTTAQVTIRDMLTHRIGTKTFQGDFTFWNTTLSRADIMERMRLLKPSGNFRQDYGYCNSCYLTAGEVIPKVVGVPWEKYVTDSIVTPLGMRNTYVASNGLRKKVSNMAVPYSTSFSDKLNEVPDDNWDNLGPAASIVSNVKDLTAWLLMQLDSGRYEGKRILPWSVLQATRDMQIPISSRKSAALPMHFRGYGLGVSTGDYNGKQIYWHTGGAAGMVSNVCFVPEANLGIAILTNNDNQGFFEALRYQVLDAYLGMPFTNRSDMSLKGFNAGEKEQMDSIAAWRARAGKKDPSIGFDRYTGTYENDLYGSIKITRKGGNQLDISFPHHPDLRGTLNYMGSTEWLLEFNNIEYGIHKVKFTRDGERVQTFGLKVNDFVEYDVYEFRRKN